MAQDAAEAADDARTKAMIDDPWRSVRLASLSTVD